MAYAIFRVSKVKSAGDLKRLAQHHERTGSTVANAKPPFDSRPAAGSPDLFAGVEASLPEKRRSDAVLAMDFVLTASPEMFNTNGKRDPEKCKRFEVAAQKFLGEQFGQCVHARFHYDETSPHAQGFIVPNDKWTPGEKLNAKALFNPKTLSDYQTKWHATLVAAGFDVDRGVAGSEAKHESIASYYARVNAAAPELPPVPKSPAPATPVQKLAEGLGIQTEHSAAVEARQRALRVRAEAKEDQRKAAIAKAREAEAKARAMERRAHSAEKQLLSLRENTAQLRALPLDTVLERLGAERHPNDPQRWETQAGSIWIEKNDGARFNSFDNPDIKGRGAVDLAMKAQGWSFDQAVAWLASEFGSERAASDVAAREAAKAMQTVQRAVKAAPEPSLLPHPEPGRLARVREYLTEARKLPARAVDALIQRGRIFADKFANACFRTDDGAGVEQRGTVEARKWRGHYGPKTGFTVPGDPSRVAIVESSIEALSLNALEGCTCVSVGGTNPRRAAEIAREWRAKGATVYAAQNADDAGDKQAAKLAKDVREVERLRPPPGKDWNDVLREMKPEQRQQLEVSAPRAARPSASISSGPSGIR